MSAAGPGLRPEQWMRSPDGSWIVRSPTSTRRISQVSTARTSRFRTLEIRGRRIGFMARPGPADHGHSSSYPSSYAVARLPDYEFAVLWRKRVSKRDERQKCSAARLLSSKHYLVPTCLARTIVPASWSIGTG